MWSTGLSKHPPFQSSQRHFIGILKRETLHNPAKWDALTYKMANGVVASVIDIMPYNSKNNQSFRTILSAKIGSGRFMYPYDASLKPLPQNPITVLRSFASIDNHPDRTHNHNTYQIRLSDDDILDLNNGALSDKHGNSTIQEEHSAAPTSPLTSAELSSSIRSSRSLSHSPVCFSSIRLPPDWIPANEVDSNDPYSLLAAFPMYNNGVKQPYEIWISLFFASLVPVSDSRHSSQNSQEMHAAIKQ